MLLPISSGEYRSTVFGSAHPDPLSSFQITTNEAGGLRNASIGVLALLYKQGVSEPLDEFRNSVRDALRDRSADTRAAAVEAMGYVPGLLETDELLRMLPRDEPVVRRAILIAFGRADPGAVTRYLNSLVADADHHVRWVVVELAEDARDERVLGRLASQDPDSYVRGLAKLALERLEALPLCSSSD